MMDQLEGECLSDGDDSDDITEYEKEQLEIALYSQVHFEENEEIDTAEPSDDAVSDVFKFSVLGNSKAGFVGLDKTADAVLNKSIGEKYGELLLNKDSTFELKSEINKFENEIKNPGHQFETLSEQSEEKNSLKLVKFSAKSTENASKKDGNKKETVTGLAEKLILGQQLSDDDEINSEAASESVYDSDDGRTYGVLGTDKKSDLDIQMNVESKHIPVDTDTSKGRRANWSLHIYVARLR